MKNLYRFSRNCTSFSGTFYFEPPFIQKRKYDNFAHLNDKYCNKKRLQKNPSHYFHFWIQKKTSISALVSLMTLPRPLSDGKEHSVLFLPLSTRASQKVVVTLLFELLSQVRKVLWARKAPAYLLTLVYANGKPHMPSVHKYSSIRSTEHRAAVCSRPLRGRWATRSAPAVY